jgi:hypothetical protein
MTHKHLAIAAALTGMLAASPLRAAADDTKDKPADQQSVDKSGCNSKKAPADKSSCSGKSGCGAKDKVSCSAKADSGAKDKAAEKDKASCSAKSGCSAKDTPKA